MTKKNSEYSSTAARIEYLEKDLAELAKMRDEAVRERDFARGQVVVAKAEIYKLTKRLDACLYSMVLLQAEVRKCGDKIVQNEVNKAMGGDSVALAG